MVLKLLAKRVGQSGKPAHVHSHIQILPLDKAGRDVRFVRVPDHFHAPRAKTLRGAVALMDPLPEFEDRLSALTGLGRFRSSVLITTPYSANWFQGTKGHCAVYGVRPMNGRSVVEIYDPGPSRAGFQDVDSYSLYRACRKKHGGIWLIAPLATAGK